MLYIRKRGLKHTRQNAAMNSMRWINEEFRRTKYNVIESKIDINQFQSVSHASLNYLKWAPLNASHHISMIIMINKSSSLS